MTNDASPSKEQFFDRIGALADEMIDAYGKDFAMGALILTARFIAQGQEANADARESLLHPQGNGATGH